MRPSDRRSRVAELHQAGHAGREIAALLDCGRSTVIRDLAWLRANGHDLPVHPPRAKGNGTTDLARRRRDLGLSQQQVAQRAGVSANTVRAVETGRSTLPSSVQAIRRALELHSSSDELPAWVSERALKVRLLADAGVDKTEIARRLGCGRATVYRDLRA